MAVADPKTPSSSPEEIAAAVVKVWRRDCGMCNSRWTYFNTRGDEDAAFETQLAAMPIIHRHVYNAGDESWTTNSFTVNHPLMREVLAKVLASYVGYDLEFKNWTFHPPYIPIVHCWDKLEDFLGAISKDHRLFSAARLLVDCLSPLVSSEVAAFRVIRSEKKVAFLSIWHLFVPGGLIMDIHHGSATISRVRTCTLSKPKPTVSNWSWSIVGEIITWNGEEFLCRTLTTRINYYEGYRGVTSLVVWPISFGNEPVATITARMVARGRKFERLRETHLVRYDGSRREMAKDGTGKDKPTSGRVMIDATAYYLNSEIAKPTATKLQLRSGETDHGNKQNPNPLADEECLLTSPWVPGCDLKTKKWSLFHVDRITEIQWDDAVFSNLVDLGNRKELALSFVTSKLSNSSEFDDFVPEKGRGIVILAFGPPGVGKTYTAEAIAEKARLPLYTLSAGSLGTGAQDVEAALTRVLDVCRRWNAVLLLDEADVFLRARQENDQARNELVSIFLTKLEYYQGVVLLTTNRIIDIDHAFQSRVDLFLQFHDLDVATKRQIWQRFITHTSWADRFEIDGEGYDRLAQLDLNGREIKNLVKNTLRIVSKDFPRDAADTLYQLAKSRAEVVKILRG